MEDTTMPISSMDKTGFASMIQVSPKHLANKSENTGIQAKNHHMEQMPIFSSITNQLNSKKPSLTVKSKSLSKFSKKSKKTKLTSQNNKRILLLIDVE